MPFYFTPYLLLPLLSALTNGGLAYYVWQRRHVPAATWLFWLMVSLSGWSLSYLLNTAATQLRLKHLFLISGTCFVSTSLVCVLPMLLEITNNTRPSRKLIMFLSIIPLCSITSALTNPWYGLFANDLHLLYSGDLLLLGYTMGAYFRTVHLPYVYLYYLVVSLVCLVFMAHRQQKRRANLFLILTATLFPLLVDMLKLSPVKGLSLTTSSLFITGICYWLSVFRHRMLSLVPVARTTLFEQMCEPVLVVDLYGRLAETNQAACNLLNIAKSNVGMSLAKLFPANSPLHDLSSCGHNMIFRCHQTGRWWHISRSETRQHDELIGYLLVLRDVTELQAVQEELRQNEERFRRLADESADMVWQLDTNLNFTYVNATDQMLRGFTSDEVVGSSAYSLLLPEDAERIRVSNAERVRLELQGVRTGAVRYEFPVLCKDGSSVWTEVHANTLRNADGVITGFICVARDISRRKVDEQRMIEALLKEQEVNSEQERFLDMISHEYRTPLAIIQSSIDLLEVKCCPQCEVVPGPLSKMNQAVERLVDIFESFRRRKGITQRTRTPDFESIEAASFFQETLAAAREFWGDRFSILASPPRSIFISGDRQLLRTALLNLLDNAIKYSIENAPVTLDVDQRDQSILFTVCNHSAVPLANNTEILFQKFRRGANCAGTSGTGVGLYLALGIVKQVGGTLELKVEGRHKVTAEMTLPTESPT